MEEVHAHPVQESALQVDDSVHYDEASASVSSASHYDHPGEPHADGGGGSSSGSAVDHQTLNTEPADLDLPEEEEDGGGDEDYARLLNSLFTGADDDMFLFEDDGEGLDPTYNPDEDSGDDSDDDVEEIQISERELQRLLTESEQPPPPMQPTAAPSSRSSSNPSQLRPVLPRVDTPVLPSTLQGIATAPPPVSAPGAGAASHPTTTFNNLLLKCPLKDSQRAQLAQQLAQHYQLLIQTAALLAFQTQRETQAASLMEILHRHCYTNVQHLIRQLKSLRDDAWKRMGFEPGPKGTGHYAPPPPIVASAVAGGGGGMGAGGAGDAYGALVVPRPLKRARGGQQVGTRRWTRHDFIRLEGHSVSLFDLPGLAAGEEVMKAIDRVYGIVDAVDEDDLEPRMEGFMADLAKAGQRVYPHRMICRLRKGRAMILYPEHDEARQAAANMSPLPIQLFTPAEQRLLVMGMQRCGDRQWGLIGVDFLPPRSIQALDWFYAVQTDVNAPPNPVKDYVLRRLETTPSTFTSKDDVALWHGVKRCGEDWHRLCREVFPRRTALELRQRFEVLYQNPPVGASGGAKGGRSKARQGQQARKRGGASGQGMVPLPPAAPLPPSPGGQMYGGYGDYDGYDYGDDDGFQEMSFSNMSWSPGASHSRLPSSSRSPAMGGGGGGTQSRDGPWRRSLVIEGEARRGAAAGGGRPGQSRVQPARGEAAQISDDEYEKESIPSDDEEGEEEEPGRRASAGTATGDEEGSDSEYEREEVSSGDEDEEGGGEDEEFERESIGSSDGEEPDD